MSKLPLAAFGALVAATIGAFFITQHIKVKTPLFNGVGLSSAAFSPAHGGVCNGIDTRVVSLSFYLQHRSDDVVVSVLDQGRNIIRTFPTTYMRGEPHAVRKYFSWNGRKDDGSLAPDGTYYFQIALLGQGRTVDEMGLPVTLKSTLPRPRVTAVSPSFATPGEPIAIAYTGNETRSGNILVYRTDLPTGARQVFSFPTKWHGTSAVWNGKINGRPAPPGTYLMGFQFIDKACNTATFPAHWPPSPGSTAHAGVTLRYLAAEPPTVPVAAGSRATVFVDSRTRPYTWRLWRAGVRKPVATGAGSGAGHPLHVELPAARGAGLYTLSLHSGAHATSVPVLADGTRAKLLVVLPALTWQGENPIDDNADGVPDTLEAGGPIQLTRPFANGLPSGFGDEAAFLQYLDRAHLGYDLTSDVALSEGIGPHLGAYKAVAFAGTERWIPGQLSALIRAFVQNGGNVLSLGIDSLRRTVTLQNGTAANPTSASATDLFGARLGTLQPTKGQSILVLHDGLGIFTTTSQVFPGYMYFQPFTMPAAAGSSPSSSAGTSDATATIVGFHLGRGMVVEIGLPGFGASLAHNVNAQELVRQLWTVLAR